jgi:cytochrome b involved in lipid metabolism
VVYDISGLQSKHPGGQKVIDLMKKREVNRFLYGYYRPENDHKTTTHVHTKESLSLCGEPIAKIGRVPPMRGIDGLAKFNILTTNQISP